MAADFGADGGSPSAASVDRRLLAGSALLVGAGLVIGMAGATMGAIAAVRAGRGYVAALGEPPQVAVRRRWRQARSATVAGVGAWQGYSRPAQPVDSR